MLSYSVFQYIGNLYFDHFYSSMLFNILLNLLVCHLFIYFVHLTYRADVFFTCLSFLSLIFLYFLCLEVSLVTLLSNVCATDRVRSQLQWTILTKGSSPVYNRTCTITWSQFPDALFHYVTGFSRVI